jgi:hypothetical protein
LLKKNANPTGVPLFGIVGSGRVEEILGQSKEKLLAQMAFVAVEDIPPVVNKVLARYQVNYHHVKITKNSL